MTLEARLRLSIIQAELIKLADTTSGPAARIIRHAANVLRLLR